MCIRDSKYRATVKDNAAKREAELNSDIKGENQKKEVVTNPNIEYYELAIDNTQQNLDTICLLYTSRSVVSPAVSRKMNCRRSPSRAKMCIRDRLQQSAGKRIQVDRQLRN